VSVAGDRAREAVSDREASALGGDPAR
jgi:hypothetical protein